MNDKQTLTFEAGKYYKTRDGQKALLLHKLPIDDFEKPFVGVVGAELVRWFTYNQVVAYALDCGDGESALDLVGEWVEPKRIKGWVNISIEDISSPGFHVARSTHIFHTRELADKYSNNVGQRIACIEIDVLEGHGLNGEGA